MISTGVFAVVVKWKISDYAFIDASDGVTEATKLGYVVKESSWVLKQDHYTLVILRKELAKMIQADKLALTSRATAMPQISPESASERDT